MLAHFDLKMQVYIPQGHRSTFNVDPKRELPLIGTMALVPQVVDALKTEEKKRYP
jgi:hypothetical protein